MKKKIVMLMMSMMLAAGAVTGCSSSSDGGSENTAQEETNQAEDEKTAEDTSDEADAADQADTDAAADDTAAAGEEIDVGGPYPVTTDWDEYQILSYNFESVGETVDMVVETNTAHDKYKAHFDFYGDEQILEFSVNGDELTVTEDLTGFITKDIDNIYKAISESDNWTPIEK